MWETLPWVAGWNVGEKSVVRTVKDFDGFYLSLMREAVEFFKSGQSPISPAEMIQVVSIMGGANRSRAAGGVWIDLRS